MTSFRFTIVLVALLCGQLIARAPDHLSSGPVAQTKADVVLKVGDKLTTADGELRRVRLPDKTLVLIRNNTTLAVTKESAIEISTGEVYIETPSGKLAPTVKVKTAARTLEASESRFAARVTKDGTTVVVTNGTVKVSGVEDPVKGGQMLTEKEQKPARTRVAHLVEWTRELRTAAPLVPVSEHCGGTLIARDPDGQEAKLELRKYTVDVHIEDGFARTTIDQTYFNHTQDRIEGTFRFPLPPDASLSRLAMYCDGTLMEGGMAERDHARGVYETIRYQQRDPALLEWVDGSTFKMRVFPLEPRQEKRIILSYTQRLPVMLGQVSYRFPAGHSMSQVEQWALGVKIKDGAGMAWHCDSHALREKKSGEDVVLEAEQKNARLDKDIVLTLTEKKSEEIRFSKMTQDGATYLMLRYRPELPSMAQASRRDWVILAETSGDRDPLIARAQIELIRAMLHNAGRDDTFVILGCGTRSTALREKPVRNDVAAVDEVLADLEKAHLIGAFDMAAALSAARPHLESVKSPVLLHIGSGIPAMGERTAADLLKRLPKGVPYVGVGVGKRWDRALMQTMAEKTGGYFTQVNPDEAIAWRGLEIVSTLDAPRLMDAAVSDVADKVSFLPFVRIVGQGEVLAAITRVVGELPAKVRITGTLDGKEFSREIEVQGVREQAAYLPRSWAKLEIDRLLAQDVVKHRERIVELSKTMYVMTPFTSLLVLENEDMYKQFKVDRGRKDHWAMYDAPAKIPVVTEFLDGEKSIRPSRKAVAQSVNTRGGFARQLTDGRFALKDVDNDGIAPLEYRLGETDYLNGSISRLAGKRSSADRGLGVRNRMLEPGSDLPIDLMKEEKRIDQLERQVRRVTRTVTTHSFGLAREREMEVTEVVVDALPQLGLLPFNGRNKSNSREDAYVPQSGQVERALGVMFSNESTLLTRHDITPSDRAFFDLLAYAPGLNTTLADLRAVLDAEARHDRLTMRGTINAKAEALLASAAKPKWRAFEVPANEAVPAYTIAFDGSGSYAWERTLASGLKEKVVCDGTTLTHIYADLGLAAKRPVGRHHRLDLATRVPIFVPSTEDLAHGCDLTLVDDNTVAVIPHVGKDAKTHIELRFVIDKGRLSERQLIEMPAKKLLRKETYSADGTVKVLDGNGKELLVIKGKLTEAQAPSLKVDVSKLLVLDMPYRTPAHVRKTLDCERKSNDQLTFEEATKLLVAYVGANDGNNARDVFARALSNRDQRHIGYYVLLASAGVNLDSDNIDVLDAHPHEPLAHYLSLHSSPTLRKHASRWAAASNTWGDGILRRLGLGHALVQRWSSGKSLGTSTTQRSKERERALEYVKQYKGSDLAWTLLSLMQDRTREEKDEAERQRAYLELAKAYELFAEFDSSSGLARYENARCLWRGGDKPNSRKRFAELYREVRKDDGLLRIDADFRAALVEAQGADSWAELLRQTATSLLEKKDRVSVLILAKQSWQLEDQVTSRRLFTLAMDDVPVKGDENRKLYTLAITMLTQTDQRDEAERLVNLLLADDEHGKRADLWRTAAELARTPARGLECREKALDLEFSGLPEVINLESVRNDYRSLLRNYRDLTQSLATLKIAPPDDFAGRVVRAADRWRALDREQNEACNLAAEVLRGLGKRELAFDYLTTTVSVRSGESDVWASLASQLVQHGERELADRAFASAFEREATNAQILWDRAENLRRAGRLALAKSLYAQIADTEWQARFTTLKQQAKWMAEGR